MVRGGNKTTSPSSKPPSSHKSIASPPSPSPPSVVSDDGVNNWFPTIDGDVVVMLVVRVDTANGPDGAAAAAAAVGHAAVGSKGGEVGVPTAAGINPRIE